MKFILAFTFVSLILSSASFDIDPTDDDTIAYFVSELFSFGDPDKFELVKEEVKEHADELLEGLFSLVGEGFEFERDMKEKFIQEFRMDKLQKVIEDIFGLGSEIASQLKQHSDVIKQNILDLIDSFMGGSSRTKRSSNILKEIMSDSIDSDDDSPKTKDDDSDEKKKVDIQDDLQINYDEIDPHDDDVEKTFKMKNDVSDDDDDVDGSHDRNGKEMKNDEHRRRTWTSDDESDDDDFVNLVADMVHEKVNKFSDMVQETGDEFILLGDDNQSRMVNYTKEEMMKNERNFRKIRKDTKKFILDSKDRLVKIFRKFGNRMWDIFG